MVIPAYNIQLVATAVEQPGCFHPITCFSCATSTDEGTEGKCGIWGLGDDSECSGQAKPGGTPAPENTLHCHLA